MENDLLWHYRFPHDGWEYDGAVSELHRNMPNGIADPYTPEGIAEPALPRPDDGTGDDHTFSRTWKPDYPETMRRVGARPGTAGKIHKA